MPVFVLFNTGVIISTRVRVARPRVKGKPKPTPTTTTPITQARTDDLGHHGGERGAGDAHLPEGDEADVEDEVDEAGAERDEERRHRVLGPEEGGLRHHAHQHGGRPDGADAGVLCVDGRMCVCMC